MYKMTTNYPNSKIQACCVRCPIEALKMLSKPGATDYDTTSKEPVAEVPSNGASRASATVTFDYDTASEAPLLSIQLARNR